MGNRRRNLNRIPSGRTPRPDEQGAAIAEVRSIYRELEMRAVQRTCTRLTRCCQFHVTGRTPMLTRGEALVAAKGVRASGRKDLPSRVDGACPMLGDNGGCIIYDARPFGCRTHFCAPAGGPYPRADVLDLVRRLETVDVQLDGDGPRALEPAVKSSLSMLR